MDAVVDQLGALVLGPAGEGPFRYSDGRQSGLSRGKLRGPRFRNGPHGVYLSAAADPSFEIGARSWLLALPKEVALCGLTAAEWYELPIRRDPEYHVIVPAGGVVPRRRPGLVTHEGLGPQDWQLFRGLPVTTPQRTFLDLGPVLSRVELVVLGDAMVRSGLATVESLRTSATNARRRRGIVLARTAASAVRSRVDSPGESRVRLVIVDGGLPCPETNLDIFDGHGGWIGRPDLCYLLLKIAIQYEGDVHRVNPARWRADIARDEVLLDNGWDVIRVTASDLRRPAALCERIRVRIDRQRRRLG